MGVFLVYKTDSQHSYASRDIIGIGTDKAIAIHLCKLQAEKDGEKISDEQLWNLVNLLQTQGYDGDGEFQFEHVETDKLL